MSRRSETAATLRRSPRSAATWLTAGEKLRATPIIRTNNPLRLMQRPTPRRTRAAADRLPMYSHPRRRCVHCHLRRPPHILPFTVVLQQRTHQRSTLRITRRRTPLRDQRTVTWSTTFARAARTYRDACRTSRSACCSGSSTVLRTHRRCKQRRRCSQRRRCKQRRHYPNATLLIELTSPHPVTSHGMDRRAPCKTMRSRGTRNGWRSSKRGYHGKRRSRRWRRKCRRVRGTTSARQPTCREKSGPCRRHGR
jgi:hypothetical protein